MNTTPHPAPVHLNGHHRDTLERIFQHPVGHNIDWQDVLSLLQAVATVQESHSGRYLVTLGGESVSFEPPRHKDIDVQQVVDLRRLLRNAGYGSATEAKDGSADKGTATAP